MDYQWNFAPVFAHFGLFVEGALGTVRLVLWSLLAAVPLGLALALVRTARVRVLATLAGIYVEVFRSAPSIVLIYWCFFALPVLAGVAFSPLVAAVLAVSLQAAAFLCEVFRGGIAAVPQGHRDAARALGLSARAAFTTVVLPQVLRNTVPMLLNRLIDLIKTTSLAAAIAYSEVVYSAMRVSSITYRPLETFTVLGSLFFVVIFALSQLARVLERRLQVSDHP